MEKLWAGRTDGAISAAADSFNASIAFDQKMIRQDITGSMAHAAMLASRGILTGEEGDAILAALEGILADVESGALAVSPAAEDVHSFVEATLTERLGDLGKKLHTARSRNDQVALDVRLYLRDESGKIRGLLLSLLKAIHQKASETQDCVMPGYTHLQRAQPVTFAHHLLAYAQMFKRDLSWLSDAGKRMNVCPLGACALAGTTFDTDRFFTAKKLGFDAPAANSMDAVSDRDFAVEHLSLFSQIMMHLSRFCEEIVLWSSWEFGFISLSDAFTTGSSIMPQKKNPDMAELIRGKTGRVYGDLMALLTTLKGLPLAYNKDMQEDKEALFDAVETVSACLSVFIPMLETLTPKPDAMRRAAGKGFINATDLADYLTKKGLPFRSAYKLSGQIVTHCMNQGVTLEELPLAAYKTFSPLFEEDLYGEIDLLACVKKRISYGSTGPDSVKTQLSDLAAFLKSRE